MDQITASDSRYDFIELHRTFHELLEDSSQSDDVDVSQTLRFGEHLLWSDLIKEYRLIILSEAGSGKTAEIRNVACALREQGKPAFFLRLENVSRDFEDAFEVGTFETFNEWLASGQEGWLLLDSVDEARLRDPGDFELAIRKLSRRISTAQDRTHIVITARTTAWRPKTDLATCTSFFPYAVSIISKCDSQTNDDGTDGSFMTETQSQGKYKQVFKIVAFDDLSSGQIALFAKARGIEDSKAFLEAVERADAQLFTSRPQDLEELIEFWSCNGRIGTRLEIMRNSIDRRLAERDQDRAEARPLSAERARYGARLLAAATTLAHEPTIRVPDGAETSKGIAIQSVLHDWDEREQATLLSRPIFDNAIYGAVRFHHRSVREYLTAEWFAELLRRETSRRNIEALFFRNQYGMDIVVPTLRPILPWLVILDEKIRDYVRRIAPEIIFEGGDPSQLPLDVRRNILREVCKQMADGVTSSRSARSYEAVQRFASPDLTDAVCALIRHYSDNEALTEYLLRMVRLGEMADALPEAMKVALKPNAEKYSRVSAFRAVNAIGSCEEQEHIRQSFLAEASELKREWLSELLKDLKPTEQTMLWLFSCLEKSEPKERFAVDHLTDAVTGFVAATEIELLPRLLMGLNRLLALSPTLERWYCKVSEKFLWLIVPACKAVERLILVRHPSSLEQDVLSVLRMFSTLHGYRMDDLSEVKAEFSKLVPAWKALNRALFWFEVQRSREAIEKERQERLTDFRQALIFGSCLRFEKDDFEYVAQEISRQTFID